jgi:hypothetical protein
MINGKSAKTRLLFHLAKEGLAQMIHIYAMYGGVKIVPAP